VSRRRLLLGGLLLLALAVPFVAVHVVRGEEMSERLQPGDVVLAERFSFLTRVPYRGEVVRTRDGHFARVLGIGGDTVEIDGKALAQRQLKLNGTAMMEPYAHVPGGAVAALAVPAAIVTEKRFVPESADLAVPKWSTPRVAQASGRWRVPAGQTFILGDGRWESRDSRHEGPYALDRVESRAVFVLYPLHRRGWLR